MCWIHCRTALTNSQGADDIYGELSDCVEVQVSNRVGGIENEHQIGFALAGFWWKGVVMLDKVVIYVMIAMAIPMVMVK